jgi:hypothetical protein
VAIAVTDMRRITPIITLTRIVVAVIPMVIPTALMVTGIIKKVQITFNIASLS